MAGEPFTRLVSGSVGSVSVVLVVLVAGDVLPPTPSPAPARHLGQRDTVNDTVPPSFRPSS